MYTYGKGTRVDYNEQYTMNNELLFTLVNTYLDRPVFFVTADVKMALGLVEVLPQYHIITGHEQPLVSELIEDGHAVFCLRRAVPEIDVPKSAGAILAHEETKSYIERHSAGQQPVVMFFKPAPKLEKLCKERGYLMAGNASVLCREFEDKVDFYRLYRTFPGMDFVPGMIARLDVLDNGINLNLSKSQFVVQTGRGWAGRGTYMISNSDELKQLRNELGEREVKLTSFVEGDVVTLNGCVFQGKTILSGPALQINRADATWAVNDFTTCGRVWPAPGLSEEITEKVLEIGKRIGSVLQQAGFKGFFGIDVIVSDSDDVYLLEVNPRRTASESFYTRLELDVREVPLAVWDLLGYVTDGVLDVGSERKEVEGTELVVRNHMRSDVNVDTTIEPGEYAYDESEWKLQKAGWNFLDSDGIWLCGSSGTVSENSEVLRLESKRSLLGIEGSLERDLVERLSALKNRMLGDME